MSVPAQLLNLPMDYPELDCYGLFVLYHKVVFGVILPRPNPHPPDNWWDNHPDRATMIDSLLLGMGYTELPDIGTAHLGALITMDFDFGFPSHIATKVEGGKILQLYNSAPSHLASFAANRSAMLKAYTHPLIIT